MIKSNLNYVSFREHMKIWGGDVLLRLNMQEIQTKKRDLKR